MREPCANPLRTLCCSYCQGLKQRKTWECLIVVMHICYHSSLNAIWKGSRGQDYADGQLLYEVITSSSSELKWKSPIRRLRHSKTKISANCLRDNGILSDSSPGEGSNYCQKRTLHWFRGEQVTKHSFFLDCIQGTKLKISKLVTGTPGSNLVMFTEESNKWISGVLVLEKFRREGLCGHFFFANAKKSTSFCREIVHVSLAVRMMRSAEPV